MVKHLHFVHNDEIWKDHIRRELQSQTRKWPEKWGFLTKEYRQMNRILEVGTESRDVTPSPSPPPPRSNGIRLPPIPNVPKQRRASYPQTTAQEIGLRLVNGQGCLEKYGFNARGFRNPCTVFNAPPDGVI
ncbi:unnamed protein product [Owenia fusiformis]|uniref:Uncharacterized protein n=1 Tax=Owenia fusiformis TaxID=6347 RepID=A0A8J1U5S7_OWEFU|nr:unnamed protein product [Owenia fusiformis]